MNPLSRIAAKRREQKAQGEAKPKAQAPAPAHLNPLARIAAKRREQKVQDEAKPKAQAPRRNRLPPANAQRNAPPEAAPESIAAEASPRVLGELAQYQAAVDAHIAAMAPMKDLAERQAYKAATALPEIMPFVAAYLDSGQRYPNSVAVQVMIWLFDVGNIGQALGLAFRLIVQGIHPMPSRFDRDMKTFVCDALYDWANERLKANDQAAPYLPDFLAAIEDARWQLHPAVLSKLYVMQAKHLERLQEYGAAASACMKAMEVNPEKHGCKGLLDRCLQAQRLAEQAGA